MHIYMFELHGFIYVYDDGIMRYYDWCLCVTAEDGLFSQP